MSARRAALSVLVASAIAMPAACSRTIAAAAEDAPPVADAPPAEGTGPTDEAPADVPPATLVLCQAPGPANPSWYHKAIGYEVFVRSFADANGDGIGDLQGLNARLDHLNDGDAATASDLGVDLVWLMPVAASPSYHGYDVTDYRAVNPQYGTQQDLADLLAAAHGRGIRVIADFVVNHSSSAHPWFRDAKTSRTAAHRDWYVWNDAALPWTRPWGGGPVWIPWGDAFYYALFWEGMPDLNWRNADLRAEMLDTARWWMQQGLDGFRLDAARYLVEDGGGAGQADTPGTHEALRALRSAMDQVKPGGLMVGEVWEKTGIVAPYLAGKDGPELGMAFDFDLADAIAGGLEDARGSTVKTALCNRLQAFPPDAAAGTFLSNHDQVRVATVAEARGPAALRLGAIALLTAPGTPWIYYGEEIGMRNGPTLDDADKRRPMQWAPGPTAGFTEAAGAWMAPRDTDAPHTVAGQDGDPASLLSLYRTLIRMRRDHPALSVGSTAVLDVEGSVAKPVVLRRERDGEVLVIVWSFAAKDNVVTLPSGALPPATRFTDLLTGTAWTRADASAALPLGAIPAFGAFVLRAE